MLYGDIDSIYLQLDKLGDCHHPISPCVNYILRCMVNPNNTNVCESLSNAPESNIQLIREIEFVRRMKNVVPMVHGQSK